MKRGGLAAVATAKVAKVANGEPDYTGRLAGLAGLALASTQDDEANRGDDSPSRAWACEEFRDGAGRLQAVKICSAFLQDHLYVVFDSRFVSPEPFVLYSTEEIEAMANKSPDEVMEIHKVKVVFRGRIIQ